MEVERRIEVKGVLRVPAAVVAKPGATAYIMENNGPHFIVKTISPEEKRTQCLIEKDTVGGETGAAGSSRCLTKGDTMANGAMLDERKP